MAKDGSEISFGDELHADVLHEIIDGLNSLPFVREVEFDPDLGIFPRTNGAFDLSFGLILHHDDQANLEYMRSNQFQEYMDNDKYSVDVFWSEGILFIGDAKVWLNSYVVGSEDDYETFSGIVTDA